MGEVSVTVKVHTADVQRATQQQLETALKKCGLIAIGHAREYVPRKTGNLAGSIAHEVDGESLEVQVGTNVEYAPYVEFDEKKHHNPPTSAHFLKKALANHVDEYQKAVESELRKIT